MAPDRLPEITHNKQLLIDLKESLARDQGYKDFRTMAENVNIVPHDISWVAKRYAEGMIAQWFQKHDALATVLQEFVSKHEAGLLPDRFVYEKAIKILNDGK